MEWDGGGRLGSWTRMDWDGLGWIGIDWDGLGWRAMDWERIGMDLDEVGDGLVWIGRRDSGKKSRIVKND